MIISLLFGLFCAETLSLSKGKLRKEKGRNCPFISYFDAGIWYNLVENKMNQSTPKGANYPQTYSLHIIYQILHRRIRASALCMSFMCYVLSVVWVLCCFMCANIMVFRKYDEKNVGFVCRDGACTVSTRFLTDNGY